jgi:hypothetical protein
MFTRTLSTVGLLFTLLACAAQTVSFDSVRLADMLLEATWPSTEKALPLLMSGLKSQLVAGGAADGPSRVFSEELQRSMTRENMSRSLAPFLSETFSDAEMKELVVFMRSPLGQKYLRMTNDISSGTRIIQPIAKQACEASQKRLSATDYASLVGICGRS